MTTMNPITPVEQHTVLVVDDHPLFRLGVCELFSLDPTIRVVGEAGTREEALLSLIHISEPTRPY